MIAPGELHRYFLVREIVTRREVWILGSDTRYEVTGPGLRDYRPAPDGAYFLAESAVRTHPWGRPMRLDEVEPWPNGRGLWHPEAWEHVSTLAATYDGSWRQAADLTRTGTPIRYEYFADGGDGQQAIVASADGRYAGTLRWSRETGIISGVGVEPGYRRKGVASRMWHLARSYLPQPRHPWHSPRLTADGRGWAWSLDLARGPVTTPAERARQQAQ